MLFNELIPSKRARPRLFLDRNQLSKTTKSLNYYITWWKSIKMFLNLILSEFWCLFEDKFIRNVKVKV